MADLADLVRQLESDPSVVDSLDDDTIIALRKYADPLGQVQKPGKKSFVNLSVINTRDEWQKKFFMTAFTGFLWRAAGEYVQSADEVPDEIRDIDPKLRKQVLMSWLARNFEFNPDMHVRSAATATTGDPEREPKDGLEQMRSKGDKFRTNIANKSESVYKYLRDIVGKSHSSVSQATGLVRSLRLALEDPKLSVEDAKVMLNKNFLQLEAIEADLAAVNEPLSASETVDAYKDVPADTLHNLNRYIDNNFEALRSATMTLYSTKPDIEFAIKYYGTFASEEEARAQRLQHEAEFTSDVVTVESGSVTILGPFKQNRDRLDFYSKNTEVMKRLMEQMESDHKLGQDMMKKRVKAKKTKNIMEAGPDDPELSKYAQQVGELTRLGAQKAFTREERERLEREISDKKREAAQTRENYETPDNAVTVGVFRSGVNEDGESSWSQSVMYTQHEVPLHMQPNSEFAQAYQPVKENEESE